MDFQFKNVPLYLSLGSNVGDRKKNIETAIALLNMEMGVPCARMSSMIQTEPWGFESENGFINAAACYELQYEKWYDPEREGLMLLEKCKKVERIMGRDTDKPCYDELGNRIYHDRIIDIDILLFGDNEIDCEFLNVPHRMMFQRDFVMIPLREIMI